MERKPQGSAVKTVTRADVAREIERASRSRRVAGEQERVLRMRTGSSVPPDHVLERADGGNPKARERVEAIQAELFRKLFATAGDLTAKEKIVRALKSKK